MSNKTGLIIGREYFSRVKKKSFILTTLLVPAVIAGFMFIMMGIAKDDSGKAGAPIAVIDKAGLFDTAYAKDKDFVILPKGTDTGFIKKYKAAGYSALLYVPTINIDSPRNITLYTQGAVSLPVKLAVDGKVNHAIENQRLRLSQIDPKKYEGIASDISVDTIDTSTNSNKKGVTGLAYGISFFCGFLIYMMMIIYGTQVMRGITEEKTNRIAEVVVSSVKPFQLMMGKIIGIGAVGLTQFVIWIILGVMTQMFIPSDFANQINTAGSSAGAILEGLSSLPLVKIGLSFLFYFLGGYLTYAALFAAVGSMASDDQQESQQLVFPILMPIILGFVIMTKAITDPQSSIAVFGSLFPLTSPIVMMGRITYDIPLWQLLLSGGLLIGCFIFLTWLTAKIYRVGILMYGKKPSWKEMMKWAIK